VRSPAAEASEQVAPSLLPEAATRRDQPR
jgi:hypothetical protein